MAKLHELLAVEADLENTAKKILKETIKVFKEKGVLFLKIIKETKMFDENVDDPPIEEQEMTTTVKDRLDYTWGHFAKYLDAIGQKEKTNQVAFADLIVGDAVIAKDVPATLLLGLESRLKIMRDLYDEIPTVPSGGRWVPAQDIGENVLYNEIVENRFKTAKTIIHKVLYEATKEHPAQIDKWDENVNVGQISIKTWSGMITPKQKADRIKKIDDLLRATKKARQRANNTEVVKLQIGKAIFDYMNS